MNLNLIDNMYRDYKISKGNGKFRLIQAPNNELKEEQKRILKEHLEHIKVHRCAFGFVKRKSIYMNAKHHLGSNTILEMDMKNFFDTVTKEQVKESLMNNGECESSAEYISKVCTRYGVTPQGAPTSPYLTNLVCKPMDKKLDTLCRQKGLKYTRYADDITISTKESGTDGYDLIQEIKPEVVSLINKYGFVVNGSKTKTVGKHRKQSVTGINVNETLNASYKDVNNFRARLHNAINDTDALMDKELFKSKYGKIESMMGYANFIYQANPKNIKYVNQVRKLKEILELRGDNYS